MGIVEKILKVWQLFIAAMTTPEGQALLNYVEYLVQDVIDGPDQSPPAPQSAADIRAKTGARVVGGQK
jgi:hypothetical protein